MASQMSKANRTSFDSTGTSSGLDAASDSWQPPNSHAGAQRGELRRVAVAPKAKLRSSDLGSQRSHGAKRPVVPVKPNQTVTVEVGNGFWCAKLRQVVRVRIEADDRLSDTTGDKGVLGRTVHSHGDIRLAPQQVFVSIVESEFQFDVRMSAPEAPKGCSARLRIR